MRKLNILSDTENTERCLFAYLLMIIGAHSPEHSIRAVFLDRYYKKFVNTIVCCGFKKNWDDDNDNDRNRNS